jgi:uncharacterized membrane protein
MSTQAVAETRPGRRSRLVLAALLVFMGTLHVLVPKPFLRLIPGWLGNGHFWVLSSGLAELASGGLLLGLRSKRAGGFAAAATIVGVYPGNIKMAFDAGLPTSAAAMLAWGRLPLQVPLVLWALKQTRS